MVTEEIRFPAKKADPGDIFQFRCTPVDREILFKWKILKSGTIGGVCVRATTQRVGFKILEPLLIWLTPSPGSAEFLGEFYGKTCPDCKGSGKIVLFTTADPCKKCGGKGEV